MNTEQRLYKAVAKYYGEEYAEKFKPVIKRFGQEFEKIKKKLPTLKYKRSGPLGAYYDPYNKEIAALQPISALHELGHAYQDIQKKLRGTTFYHTILPGITIGTAIGSGTSTILGGFQRARKKILPFGIGAGLAIASLLSGWLYRKKILEREKEAWTNIEKLIPKEYKQYAKELKEKALESYDIGTRPEGLYIPLGTILGALAAAPFVSRIPRLLYLPYIGAAAAWALSINPMIRITNTLTKYLGKSYKRDPHIRKLIENIRQNETQ